jgi:GNAT superfamily N-acetyltransferase
MNLNEEIKRIKGLMLENSNPFTISTSGSVNIAPGIHISINDGEVKMGHSNLINFDDANVYDYDFPRLLEDVNEYCKSNCSENFFNNNNSVYLHDLKVFEPYRGKGLSNRLMDECHNLGKDMGVDYITLITDCTNSVAQNLYRKHGYEVYKSDGVKDLFYKQL